MSTVIAFIVGLIVGAVLGTVLLFAVLALAAVSKEIHKEPISKEEWRGWD